MTVYLNSAKWGDLELDAIIDYNVNVNTTYPTYPIESGEELAILEYKITALEVAKEN